MPAHPHLKYAERVARGKIRASQSVILQCKRTLAEHKAGFVEAEVGGETLRFIFDPERIRGRIDFIQRCPHPAGRWRANDETIRLEPWQEFFISEVYGWINEANPRERRYDEAILFIPRKNGKTTLSATLALHEIAWGDAGAEVYSAATKSDQSAILWKIAKKMAEGMDSSIGSLFRITHSEIASRQGVFRNLPSKSKTQDGYNPSLALIDESAAIEDANQIHVLESGMGSRDSPLTLHLTTAQPLRTTLFKSRYSLAKRGLETGKIAPNLFAMLYELDDVDEIDDPKNWIKANPNLGVSITKRKLASAIERSHENPRERSLMLCKHFNIWSQYESAWLNLDTWNQCAGSPLREGPAYIGLDLAENRDLCAACIVWDNGGQRYSVDWKFWTPRKSLGLYPEDAQAVLLAAAQSGLLVLLESPVVDAGDVKAWVCEQFDEHDIRRIGIDPWHAKKLTVELEELGYPILQVQQTQAKLTDPIKEVENVIIRGDLAHPGYSLMEWMVENVVVVSLKGKILNKPESEPHRKIDGVAALVTAFACVDYAGVSFSLSDLDLEELGDLPEMPASGEVDENLMYV